MFPSIQWHLKVTRMTPQQQNNSQFETWQGTRRTRSGSLCTSRPATDLQYGVTEDPTSVHCSADAKCLCPRDKSGGPQLP